MPFVMGHNGELYRPYHYQREDEFEGVVVSLADQIFGPSTIYVDVKKRLRGNNIVTIPDGYLIDTTTPDDPKLFVVENEIVGHDPFKHVGIQLLKFATSFEDSHRQVRSFLMDEVAKMPTSIDRLSRAQASSQARNIDDYLDQAVYGEFKAVVVIDEARTELHKVLEKINANISVIELRTFEGDGGQKLHQFDTLYDEDDETQSVAEPQQASKALSPEERDRYRARRAKCDTIIVPAHKEGFNRVFLGEDQWYTVRIGAAMKDKIKFIAAYQVAPVSAITHVAEVKEIKRYKDTGKYVVLFKGPAEQVGPIRLKDSKYSPQGPCYAEKTRLDSAGCVEDVLR